MLTEFHRVRNLTGDVPIPLPGPGLKFSGCLIVELFTAQLDDTHLELAELSGDEGLCVVVTDNDRCYCVVLCKYFTIFLLFYFKYLLIFIIKCC